MFRRPADLPKTPLPQPVCGSWPRCSCWSASLAALAGWRALGASHCCSANQKSQRKLPPRLDRQLIVWLPHRHTMHLGLSDRNSSRAEVNVWHSMFQQDRHDNGSWLWLTEPGHGGRGLEGAPQSAATSAGQSLEVSSTIEPHRSKSRTPSIHNNFVIWQWCSCWRAAARQAYIFSCIMNAISSGPSAGNLVCATLLSAATTIQIQKSALPRYG